jgi:hypothetical protein
MISNPSLPQRLFRGDLAIIFYLSLLRLLLHVFVNANEGYGLFRDEYYYLACAANPAIGYVDHPPLCALLLKAIVAIFGDSLFVVRLIPAVAGAFTVFVTGLIALRLGGGKLAAFIACLCSYSAINLVMSGYYSMNAIDILIWTTSAYVIVRIIQEERKTLWIVLGIILGLGLLNKTGVLFLAAGIFAGLIFTSQRKWFRTPWPYIAGVIAFVLFMPYIIWNVQHDFAHLEFIHNASAEKYSSLSAIDFLKGQILINNPVALFIWLPGLVALFMRNHFKPYRILGWMYLAPLLILIANGTSKPEYLAPAYGMLYAAGGVFWERLTVKKLVWRYSLTAILVLWLLLTATFLPMVLPILPVEKYIGYADGLGFKPSSSEGKEQSELPQFYADMFGWKEKVEGVADVYQSLSEDEKTKCAIYGTNYGRCAAIDYYGNKYGLPKTIGNHNNYWIWGPRNYTGEVMIILGGDLEDHQPDFREVTLAKVVDCTYCMPYEDQMPIYVCKGLKVNLREIWSQEKHFE